MTGISGVAQVSSGTFFNWETAPVHPLELSPDKSILAVCNLPDNRLELFDVNSGRPVALTNVPVGLDPVTVRFRSTTQVWVANYISDSISVIDLPTARVVATVPTANEPSDIIFAGNPERAYVSCGQPNLVQVFDPITLQWVTNLVIDGNRPRAMAKSRDGNQIYVAIFESGNASTIIGKGISSGFPRATSVEFPFAPSGGLDPPPNFGANFYPSINPLLGTNLAPRTGLIVKKDDSGKWMDDNKGDWTEFIHGTNAAFTGRIPGWDLPDHDLAVIDTSTFSIRYISGLMNICMALAVNPVSGKINVVGTEALNQIRFTPVLNGIFVRVNLAQVDLLAASKSVVDLNPHLDYSTPQVSDTKRQESIGDPRGMVWSSDGSTGFITGMGSDNLIIVDAEGRRSGTNSTIKLDQAPTGLAMDEVKQRLYVFSRFADTVTTVDVSSRTVIDTFPLFDPTPRSIKLGRPHLYSTHATSGLGQAACASCHVDSRFDRLAWDLGDPTDQMKRITNANFANFVPGVTNHFHPMKGPMTTQTLQDIIGHEPFHWRGDRDGLEEFSSTFTNLQGAAATLTTSEMQELKDFLGTVRFPPNPFRQFDNSLSTNVVLTGQVALGRGGLPAGAPLPNGNAQAGQLAFRLSTGTGCIPCHTLPSGLGTDMHFNGATWQRIALGTNSAHHVALIELERSSELPFKVPHLRNLFDKFGMDLTQTNSRAGFGFSHDGSVDSLPRFVEDAFGVTDDQTIANLTAFLLSFSGSDLISGSPVDRDRSPGVASLDTPASVGTQITLSSPARTPLLDQMIARAMASTSRVDLIVKGWKNNLQRGWLFDPVSGNFQSDRRSEILSPDSLRALASVGGEQTYTLVPGGSGRRIGIDRDSDGYFDRDELDFGSDPANPLSLATNTPPRLDPIPDKVVLNGRLLTFAVTASDSDMPSQQLTFSLGTNAPAGAEVNQTNGTFNWVPAGPSGSSTNSITVVVTDNGNPNRSDSKTFDVITTDLNFSSIQTDASGTTLDWQGLAGVSYRIQFKNALNDPVWNDLPGDIPSTNGILLKTDPAPPANVTRFYRVLALP